MRKTDTRNRRVRAVRAHTESFVRLTVLQRKLLHADAAAAKHDRPRLRAQCTFCVYCQAERNRLLAGLPASIRLRCGHAPGEVIYHSRPCVFVSCHHNLYLDVARNGSLKLNFPDLEPGEMIDSCSLDVASKGRHLNWESVGALMNVTRERIAQLEYAAMQKLEPVLRRLFRKGEAA